MPSNSVHIAPGPSVLHSPPMQPSKRLSEADISIELCSAEDAEKTAEGLYACYPETAWDKKEPLSLRPAEPSARAKRLAKRLLPTLTHPSIHWLKAVLGSTHETVGVACWIPPGHADIHNLFRRSAIEHYGWKASMGWTDEEIEEMWAHVDGEAWNAEYARNDEIRRAFFDGEKHWYLAMLITWPEYQGRGVGGRLLRWAMEKADGSVPPEAMYLESSQSARAVYAKHGFVPLGAVNFVRRGPMKSHG